MIMFRDIMLTVVILTCLSNVTSLPISVQKESDDNVASFYRIGLEELPQFYQGFQIIKRFKRIDRVARSIKSKVSVCYPDGKNCLPSELCEWRGSVERKLCRCIKDAHCEHPYTKKGKYDSVKAKCSFADNRLQCFCFVGYEWSNSGKCIAKKVAKNTKKPSDKSGLPGSFLLALALIVVFLAVGGAAYCFYKRRRDGADVSVSPPPARPTSTAKQASAPSDDEGGEAETALLSEPDTKKLLKPDKPNKSRSRLSITRKKKSKDKGDKKSRSASGTSKNVETD